VYFSLSLYLSLSVSVSVCLSACTPIVAISGEFILICCFIERAESGWRHRCASWVRANSIVIHNNNAAVAAEVTSACRAWPGNRSSGRRASFQLSRWSEVVSVWIGHRSSCSYAPCKVKLHFYALTLSLSLSIMMMRYLAMPETVFWWRHTAFRLDNREDDNEEACESSFSSRSSMNE